MITEVEERETITRLLNLKEKLLWVLKQNPVNEEQKNHIIKGKEELTKVNMWLGVLGVELSN